MRANHYTIRYSDAFDTGTKLYKEGLYNDYSANDKNGKYDNGLSAIFADISLYPDCR